MSYQLSDDESTDSESGIRFKTESTRKIEDTSYIDKSVILGRTSNKYDKNNSSNSSQQSDKGYHSKNYQFDKRSDSNDRHRRSSSYDRYRRSSSYDRYKQSQSPEVRHSNEHKYRKHKHNHKTHRRDKNEYEHHKHRRHKNNEIKRQNSSSEDEMSINLDNSTDSDKSSPNKNRNYKKRKESTSEDEIPSTSHTQIESDKNLYGPTLPPKNISPESAPKKQIENIPEPESPKKIEMECIGPALPPGLKKNEPTTDHKSPDLYIGPALPPGFIKNESSDRKSPEKDSCIGPALPPGFTKNESETDSRIDPALPKKSNTIGPSIPDDIREKLQNSQTPILDDSDDDMIGPLPEGHSSSNLSHKLLEERALEMRINKLTPSGPENLVREEWMLELPEVQAGNLGLGPRQFRKNNAPDMSDRSSWTDTPQDKEKKRDKQNPVKIDIKKQCELEYIAKKDKEQEKIVEKHKKKRKKDKSLVDMHRDKMKKKEETQNKPERRPFDRDVDLKVNRFDEAQKKAIFKKAQLLDTRFSSGESKFL